MLKFNRSKKRLVIPAGINPSYGIDSSTLYNVSDADIVASDVLEGKIAYGKDGKIVGTLDVQGEKEESYQAGIEEQKSKLESITITENGSYSREDGYNEVIVDVPDLNGDYNEGVEAGIEIGKAEVIEGMNDATITAGTVFKGEIGYGKDGERIVGEFEYVEGFDFGKIGYSQELSNELNSDTATKLAYSKQLYDAWDPSTTNASRYFQNDSSLLYAPLVDTSNVTDMSYMLYQCPNLKVIPDYNYDKVINMQNFCSYSGNTSLNLDLKSCTNADMIASYNTNINDASINFNNTECDCYGMFYECSNLKNVNIKNVNSTSCSSAFYRCRNLTTITFENFNATSTCSSMFYYCQNLTSVPLFDTSQVTNMNNMFQYCSKLTSVPLFDTSQVTNIKYMFDNCSSLTSVPLFDTSNVTDMERMFYQCSNLTSIPQFNTSKVTRFRNTFYGCKLLEFPSLDTSKVVDVDGMIKNNTSLTKINALNLESVNDTGGVGSWNGFNGLSALQDVIALNNLGKGFTRTVDDGLSLESSTKLTRESCLNIFNTIYDMNLNTIYTKTAIIKLSSNTKALLSDEDIAIATAKGWTIS